MAARGGRGWGRLALMVATAGVAVGLVPVIDAAHLSHHDAFPAGGVDAAPFDVLVRSEVGTRAALGFRSDAAFVGELVVRQRFGDPSIEMVNGFAFSKAEATELRTRDDLRASVIGIGNYGSTQPDSYAGVYLDQASGTVVVRFTGDVARHAANLAAGFIFPERLRVTQARWTVREMSAASADVIAARPVLEQLGAQVVGVSASPIDNDVLVLVTATTPELADYFATHFPAGLIELRVGSPARTG